MFKVLKGEKPKQSIDEQILERIAELNIDIKGCSPLNIKRIRGEQVADGAPMDSPLYMALYTSTLSEYIQNGFPSNTPEPIKKQLIKALNNGELCVYLSAIYHMLCSFAYKESECNFYIGYVETTWSFDEVTNMFLGSIEIPNIPVTNFHSCVSIDNKIVDVCYLFQNEGMESLGEIIYGDYPDGAKMWGWDMSHYVPVLLDRYAKTSGIDMSTFIEQHCMFFASIIEETLNTNAKKASL